MDRYDKSELEGTDSDYLCVFCYDPLYVKDGTVEEACFNRACPAYVNRMGFAEDVNCQRWAQDAKTRCAESIQQFCKFERAFLFRRLFEARADESEQLFQNKFASCNVTSSVDYLLTQLARNTLWGDSKDVTSYLRALRQYYNDFDTLLVAERRCSKYCIFAAGDDLYIMKYHHSLVKFHKTLGIVSAKNIHDVDSAHPFDLIGRKSVGMTSEDAFDFEATYSSIPAGITQLSHTFKMGHAVSEIHQYPASFEDFVALYSTWTRCISGTRNSITGAALRSIYGEAMQKNNLHGNFEQFLTDYTSGSKYAPILVFDGEKYHFEYHDLLLYLVHLLSNNKTRSGRQTVTGQTIFGRLKRATACDFEGQIRQKLRGDGFEVHPAPDQPPLRMSFDGKKAEFDCIAVDPAKKIVVIIEAKYEDIAPSSKAGTTIVDQLVLDRRRGLLAHAKRHHQRRLLFKRHFAGLKNFDLDLPGSFHDYAVHTVIVTKHEPLISRHITVDIVSYEKFASIDFRGDVDAQLHPAPALGLPRMLGATPNGSSPQSGPDFQATASAAATGAGRRGGPGATPASDTHEGRDARHPNGGAVGGALRKGPCRSAAPWWTTRRQNVAC